MKLTVDEWVAVVDRAIQMVGEDHVALGTDFGELGGDRIGDGRVDSTGQINKGLVAGEFLQHGLGVGFVVEPQRDFCGDVAQSPPGVGRLGGFRLGVGQLLADLDRLEGQRPGLDGEGELVVVAVDERAAHGLLHVGDLELARRLGAQARSLGHLQREQLRGGDQQHEEHDGVADSMPEHEGCTAQTVFGHRLASPPRPRRALLVWLFLSRFRPTRAAASIVAKVIRDRQMVALHQQHPGYNWASNKGYGTPEHYSGLTLHGVTVHHRRSFAPIHNILYGDKSVDSTPSRFINV